MLGSTKAHGVNTSPDPSSFGMKERGCGNSTAPTGKGPCPSGYDPQPDRNSGLLPRRYVPGYIIREYIRREHVLPSLPFFGRDLNRICNLIQESFLPSLSSSEEKEGKQWTWTVFAPDTGSGSLGILGRRMGPISGTLPHIPLRGNTRSGPSQERARSSPRGT